MILKYWTLEQESELQEAFEKYQIPQKVQKVIRNTLKILDDNYGANRSVADDDGGYVALLISDTENNVWKEYDEVLKEHHLEQECAEFEDTICNSNKNTWYADLYLAGSEYGVTIVYPIGSSKER